MSRKKMASVRSWRRAVAMECASVSLKSARLGSAVSVSCVAIFWIVASAGLEPHQQVDDAGIGGEHHARGREELARAEAEGAEGKHHQAHHEREPALAIKVVHGDHQDRGSTEDLQPGEARVAEALVQAALEEVEDAQVGHRHGAGDLDHGSKRNEAQS